MAHERSSIIQGLRELADFLEQHPLLPARKVDMSYTVEAVDPEEATLLLQSYAKQMGSFEKSTGNTLFWITKKFSGDVELSYFFPRNSVCTPRVVGKRKVQRVDYANAPKVEVEEDVLEWDCAPSILSPSEAERCP